VKKSAIALALFVFVGIPLWSQVKTSKLKIRAVLVDKDLNQKPAPHLTVVLSADRNGTSVSHEAKTDFDGNVEIALSSGKYKLTTPQGVDFQSRHYTWGMEINLGSEPASLELSNDNALVSDLPSVPPTRKFDDLTSMFQKYQRSVVTVWSEVGSGTGFIVDGAGLVITNHHVVGPSELISIQFDSRTKVAPKVLAFDPERDVAVLLANLSVSPDALTAPIARDIPIAVEGERVFSIGSPLGLKKIITSGIVSKVEERAIISDVNINHGNSGGPLFNSLGQVIGITTFLVPGENGPGVSGVVRIDQAFPILEQARKKMRDVPAPDVRLLPVEPTDPYPLDALKETIKSTKFERKPYIFTMGGFDVALGTPILKYELQEEVGLAAEKEKGKRTRKRDEAVRNTFEPLQELRDWAEYVGEYKPVLLVQAAPQLRETFMSALGRGMALRVEFMEVQRT
jgi:S1-C subfamily serine protease